MLIQEMGLLNVGNTLGLLRPIHTREILSEQNKSQILSYKKQ